MSAFHPIADVEHRPKLSRMSANDLIRDWTSELLLLIERAKAEAANDDGFTLGRKFGLAEALALMQQQAQSFGFKASELGLPEEDAMIPSLRD